MHGYEYVISASQSNPDMSELKESGWNRFIMPLDKWLAEAPRWQQPPKPPPETMPGLARIPSLARIKSAYPPSPYVGCSIPIMHTWQQPFDHKRIGRMPSPSGGGGMPLLSFSLELGQR